MYFGAELHCFLFFPCSRNVDRSHGPGPALPPGHGGVLVAAAAPLLLEGGDRVHPRRRGLGRSWGIRQGEGLEEGSPSGSVRPQFLA